MPEPALTWTPASTHETLPDPDFPPEAVIPEGWISLPTDLYFIRHETLWHWPRERSAPQQVVAASQYRLTPEGRYLVYTRSSTTSAFGFELLVNDLASGESIVIPTTGSFMGCPLRRPTFDISPDGRYVVYIAWNVQPKKGDHPPGFNALIPSPRAGGCGYGTIFAVEVQNTNHNFELGYCTMRSEYGWELRCDGFVLSPDGQRIAFSDGRGVWLSEIPQGRPRLIAEHQQSSRFCGVWRVRNWSPDGRHLLIDVGCFEGGYAAVMDVDTGAVKEIPHTWSYPDAYVAVSWTQQGTHLLVTQINHESGIGAAYMTQVPAEDPIHQTVVLSVTWPGTVWPTELHSLTDGRIGFANQRCVDSEGMRAGIYTMGQASSSLEFVAPLPTLPCYVSDGIQTPFGAVLWAPDGRAYLYFSPEQQPSLLGVIDGALLWDVRALLAQADSFQWQPLYAGH